jgi:hypothetical protein
VSAVRNECVAQNVAVPGGQRHALEVPVERSSTYWTTDVQCRADRAHAAYSIFGVVGHEVSIPTMRHLKR